MGYTDRRLQLTLLADFYNKGVPGEGFKFSPSGIYTQPAATDYEGYINYIKDRPINDNPEIGLFHTVSHTLSGYASEADYNVGTDPFGVASNIAIPMLAINALDDPVCVEGNIEYKFFTEQSDWWC